MCVCVCVCVCVSVYVFSNINNKAVQVKDGILRRRKKKYIPVNIQAQLTLFFQIQHDVFL